MDEMKLPVGYTCGDCAHFSRCEWLVSAKPSWTTCDFHPRRFMYKPSTPVKSGTEESK